jgi:PKD repeat protein
VNPNGATNFTYTLTSTPCGAVTSSTAVTVYPLPTATITSPTPICATSSTILTFSTASTTAGLTTYKIISDYPTANSIVYASSTTAPVSPLTVSSAFVNPSGITNYTYTVTTVPCSPVTASTAVTVYPVPTATISSPTPICATSSTILTLSTTNTTSGVTTYKITSDYPSANTIVYNTSTTSPVSPFTVASTFVNPNGNTNYTFTVRSAPCANITASTIVNVVPSTAGGVLSAGAIVCEGSTNNTTFTLTGHVGAIQKWQQSNNDGLTWTDITNTSVAYTAINITASTLFRVMVKSGAVCNSVYSLTSGVFVNTNPVANFTNSTVCFNLPPTVFTNTTIPGTTLTPSQQIAYNIPGAVTIATTYSWDFGDGGSASNTSTLQNPTHTFSASGSFNVGLTATTNTIIGALSSFCSHNTLISVVVLSKPSPPVFATTNPSSICYKQQGVNFKVDTVTGMKYLWSSTNTAIKFYAKHSPNTLIDFPATGSPFDIYITAINLGNCRDSSKVTLSAAGTIPDPPQLMLTNNNKTLVCLDNTQASYQWGYDDGNTFIATDIAGATLQDYTATGGFDFANKNYYVKLISGGCAYKVYYNTPTGIQQNNGTWKIKLQPNPNSGAFILTLDGNIIPGYSCITDILGKQVSILNLHAGSNNIDVHDLSVGIYYLQVMNNLGNHQSLKFIINK